MPLGYKTSGGDFFFTFKSIAGRTYRIECKDSLTDIAWLALGADITATASTTEVHDFGAIAGQPTRFYRAKVLPSP